MFLTYKLPKQAFIKSVIFQFSDRNITWKHFGEQHNSILTKILKDRLWIRTLLATKILQR